MATANANQQRAARLRWSKIRYHINRNATTLCLKKSHLMFDNNLANVDRFSKFFHQLIREKILYVYTQRLPPHLQCVATLPRRSQKSKNVLFVRRHLESTVKPTLNLLLMGDVSVSVECCYIMVIFSPWLSLHHLRSFYAIFQVSYTYLNKIISAIFFVTGYIRSHSKF